MPREIRSFRVEAVVLKHQDHGEADRMLSVYTRQRGKLRALAKGVRKVHSRKSGHVEPFTLVSLQLAVGRHWYVVSQAEAKDTYSNLREDLELMGYASYVAEILDKFTYEEEGENTSIFRNLINTLKRLDQGEDPLLTVRYYEIHLLEWLGFRPELHHCVVCEEEIQPQDQYFAASLGGAVCPEHGHDLTGAVPISIRALKYLRHFQRSPFREAKRAQITPKVHQEMEILMQHYITYLLERGLNSPAFLRRVRRERNQSE
jgi:DNA repair protein RecO (recombination protein O)